MKRTGCWLRLCGIVIYACIYDQVIQYDKGTMGGVVCQMRQIKASA